MPIDKLTLGAAMALCGGGGGEGDIENVVYNTANSVVREIAPDIIQDIMNEQGGSNLPLSGSNSVQMTNCSATGTYSFAEGYGTTASGDAAHSEGRQTTAGAASAHAEGMNTSAQGTYSHAEGSGTIAAEQDSHAEGSSTKAQGISSHAEGSGGRAVGECSHAEGKDTVASGNYSHAEGRDTKALYSYSHAEGNNTTASASCSHAEGFESIASGSYSHTQGYGTIAKGNNQTALGKFNVMDETGQYAEIVGNGLDANNRSNARTLDWNGNEVLAGTITASGVNLNDSVEYLNNIAEDLFFEKPIDLGESVGYKIKNDNPMVSEPIGSNVANYKFSVSPGDLITIEATWPTTYNDSAYESRLIRFYSCDVEELPSVSYEIPFHPVIHKKQDEGMTFTEVYTVPKRAQSAMICCSSAAKASVTKQAIYNAENIGDIKESILTLLVNPYREDYFYATRNYNAGDLILIGSKLYKVKNAITSGQKIPDYSYQVSLISYFNGTGTPSGNLSHTEGFSTTASGQYAHAEGLNTSATGTGAHAEGSSTIASGNHSHAEGFGTEARATSQHVFGEFNVVDNKSGVRGDFIEIVGNGWSDISRSNCRTLDWSGNEILAGTLTLNKNGTNEVTFSPAIMKDIHTNSNGVATVSQTNSYISKKDLTSNKKLATLEDVDAFSDACRSITADIFSSQITYNPGSYVVKDGTLYKFIDKHYPSSVINNKVSQTKVTDEIIKTKKMIAGTEEGPTCRGSYLVGELVITNNGLMQATSAIDYGDQISDANAVSTTIAKQLLAITQRLDRIENRLNNIQNGTT